MTRTVVITDLDRASTVAASWDRVPARGSSSLFTSPAWALAAWRNLPDFGEPLLILARDRSGAMTGVFPLAQTASNIKWAGSPLGDEHDLRLATDSSDDVACHLACRLREVAANRDVVLNDSRPDSHLVGHINQTPGCPAPLLRLVGGNPEFGPLGRIPGWSRKRRRGLQSAIQRLQAVGTISVDWITGADRLAALVPTFVADRLSAWRARGRINELPPLDRDPALPDFLTDACRGLAAHRRCLLAQLKLDRIPIAQSLLFVGPTAYHLYMSTYRPEMSTYSPSHLLLAHIADRISRLRVPTIDLGRGDEPYKFDHGAISRRLTNFRFHD